MATLKSEQAERSLSNKLIEHRKESGNIASLMQKNSETEDEDESESGPSTEKDLQENAVASQEQQRLNIQCSKETLTIETETIETE